MKTLLEENTMPTTFGEFIKQKRTSKGINLRKFAELLDIAPGYMSDIEQSKRNSPSNEKMKKIEEILGLSEDDKNQMYDLAAQTRENEVAPDISAYIASNDMVRIALRTAKNLQLSNCEWMKIIEQMTTGDKGK